MTTREMRAWLHAWGRAHGYPSLLIASETDRQRDEDATPCGQRYALGYEGGKDIWEMEVALGCDAMIQAAYRYLSTRSGRTHPAS